MLQRFFFLKMKVDIPSAGISRHRVGKLPRSSSMLLVKLGGRLDYPGVPGRSGYDGYLVFVATLVRNTNLCGPAWKHECLE